jgi:hypothetical protein
VIDDIMHLALAAAACRPGIATTVRAAPAGRWNNPNPRGPHVRPRPALCVTAP